MMSVVFDIGGVIYEDIWETVFLKPGTGISEIFNIDPKLVSEVCNDLWKKHAVLSTNHCSWKKLEREYWAEAIDRLGFSWSINKCIKNSIQFIEPITGMNEVINLLADKKVGLGVCSNQTAFWFERQLSISQGLKKIDRRNMILSFEQGITKEANNNRLFEILVSRIKVSPDQILYIEDRPVHHLAAIEYGFQSLLFNKQESNMVGKLKSHLISCGLI